MSTYGAVGAIEDKALLSPNLSYFKQEKSRRDRGVEGVTTIGKENLNDI